MLPAGQKILTMTQTKPPLEFGAANVVIAALQRSHGLMHRLLLDLYILRENNILLSRVSAWIDTRKSVKKIDLDNV